MISSLLIFIVTVRIGFEETAYTVIEEDGTQEVCVRVFVPDDEEPLAASISAVIATRVGTAGIIIIC